jgi:hypothetical protein
VGQLVPAPIGGAVVVRPQITDTAVLLCAIANMKPLMPLVHSRYFVSEVFLDLESRVPLAVQRAEVGDGCFEATLLLLLAQVFASLPESLARHVRLVGSFLQFTHALTTGQRSGYRRIAVQAHAQQHVHQDQAVGGRDCLKRAGQRQRRRKPQSQSAKP